MSKSESQTRDFLCVRFMYNHYDRVYSVIYPPMAYMEFAVRTVVFIGLMVYNEKLAKENTFTLLMWMDQVYMIFRILLCLFMLKTLYLFFIMKAQYYVMKKKNTDALDDCCDCSTRTFFTEKLIVSQYQRTFTLIRPPITIWQFISTTVRYGIICAILWKGSSLLRILDKLDILKTNLVNLPIVILVIFYIKFLLDFYFPEADYYVMKKVVELIPSKMTMTAVAVQNASVQYEMANFNKSGFMHPNQIPNAALQAQIPPGFSIALGPNGQPVLVPSHMIQQPQYLPQNPGNYQFNGQYYAAPGFNAAFTNTANFQQQQPLTQSQPIQNIPMNNFGNSTQSLAQNYPIVISNSPLQASSSNLNLNHFQQQQVIQAQMNSFGNSTQSLVQNQPIPANASFYPSHIQQQQMVQPNFIQSAPISFGNSAQLMVQNQPIQPNPQQQLQIQNIQMNGSVQSLAQNPLQQASFSNLHPYQNQMQFPTSPSSPNGESQTTQQKALTSSNSPIAPSPMNRDNMSNSPQEEQNSAQYQASNQQLLPSQMAHPFHPSMSSNQLYQQAFIVNQGIPNARTLELKDVHAADHSKANEADETKKNMSTNPFDDASQDSNVHLPAYSDIVSPTTSSSNSNPYGYPQHIMKKMQMQRNSKMVNQKQQEHKDNDDEIPPPPPM